MSLSSSHSKRDRSPSHNNVAGSRRTKGKTETRSSDLPKNRSGAHYKPSAWGEHVGSERRIVLKGELGKGTRSTVFRCVDTKLPDKEFAVKFIRLSETLREATLKELKLLRSFKGDTLSCDPEGADRLLCLASVEVLEHEGHLALVFERQKCCLKTALLKYGHGKGLALVNIQSITRDIFLALRVLRKIGLIHCDLKPANLLVSVDGKSIKLSDFGSAVNMSTRMFTDNLQPIYYRAPEIILGQLYGTEIDMWSAGLTLFQLATGSHFMTGETNNAMLHAMLQVFGAFPTNFSTEGKYAMQHFNSSGSFRLGYGYVPMSEFPAQSNIFAERLELEIKEAPTGGSRHRHKTRLLQLADLLTLCVVPEPSLRATPEVALEHIFALQIQ